MPNKLRNILFATDFSPASRAALRCAVELTAASGARLWIAHVLPAIPTGPTPRVYQGMDDFLRTEADKRLRALTRAAHARGVAARGLTLRGLPHGPSAGRRERRRVELVVLGTHAGTGRREPSSGASPRGSSPALPVPSCRWLAAAEEPSRGGSCSRRTSRRRPGPPGGSRSGSRKPTGPGFASSMCGRGWLGVRGLRGPTPRRRARSGRTRGGGFRRSCGPRGRPACARRRSLAGAPHEAIAARRGR